MSTYNVVLVTPSMFDEAVEIIYQSFVNDFITNYYLCSVSKNMLEYVRRELIVQQMTQYLNNPRMAAFALVNDKNRILAILVWSFPAYSSLLIKAKSQVGSSYYKYGFFKHWFTNFCLGSKAFHKFHVISQQMSYVENELLNIHGDRIYKLLLLGTDPRMQRRGLAKSLVLTIVDQIENQDMQLIYDRKEKINNCDYDKSNISSPIILSHATNSSYYSNTLGFESFATVYLKDNEIDMLRKQYTSKNFQKINNSTYMTISIMVKNRKPMKNLIVVP